MESIVAPIQSTIAKTIYVARLTRRLHGMGIAIYLTIVTKEA